MITPSRLSLPLRALSYIHHYPLILYRLFSQRKIHNALFPRFFSPTCTNQEPHVSALIFAVKSCSSVSYCQAIHARVVKSVNYSDGFIGDQLVFVYVKYGCAEDAQMLFDEIPNKDVVSWNSLISGFLNRGFIDKCLSAFFTMKFEIGIKPNEVTLLSIVSACSDMGALDVGKYIHGYALKMGMLLETKVANSLVNMYGKSGNLDAACRIFEAISIKSIVSWNSMIVIYTQNGFAEGGVSCFNLMRTAGVKPDEGTMVALLRACEDLGVGKLAEGIHGVIFSCCLNANERIATALLNLYAKLGRLNASHKVFGEMIHPDRVAWTAMLAGYAVHGFGRKAMELFEYMVKEGLEPDHVTFTHLLNACSHSGFVKEGRYYFKIMSEVHGIEPRLDHYSCMVDLLGRSGLLNDAYELIINMPMEPNSGVWGALLSACRVYGDIELGKVVAERLIALDPLDPRNYILLSNIFCVAGLWRDASKVRALMKDRSLIRNPGCSFIEHGNKMHRFVVGDRSHPLSEKIYVKLEELIGKIRKAGFVSKTEFVLHDVEEEVKEDMINKHSEKLAIAFGLLVTNAGMPLIITKNLRICGDCHSTAKFISLVEKRAIIIRDSKRFHHFDNGLCSCGDYW
jgi:pentatricopeptide repeat protein